MKPLRIVLFLIVAAILVVAALWLAGKDDAPVPEGPGDGFFGAIIPSGTSPTASQIDLSLSDGTVVQVADFTTGKTASELPNATYYEMTESDSAARDSFTVTYGTDSSFAVELLVEPLRDSRLAAEAYLRQKLELSDAQLCRLELTVAVPNNVNEFYSGSDLGLSFCPDAVPLP